MQASQVRPRGPLHFPKPERSAKYLRFIREQPCLVCSRDGFHCRVEAAHTGAHGMGRKASDLDAVPLCAAHHRNLKDSYHNLGRQKFEATHQLEIQKEIGRLRRLFDATPT
jgi:hypothetical protein